MQKQPPNRSVARIEEPGALVNAAAALLSGALSGDKRAAEVLYSSMEKIASASAQDSPYSTLTMRQREVLDLLAQDKDSTQICHQLWITESTLRDHKTGIRKAYDACTTRAAVSKARRMDDINMEQVV